MSMPEQNKSSKRTFGLVSGYGSDTESEDSDSEEVTKKQKVGDNGEEDAIKDQNDEEEEIPEIKAPSASWMRARREYEESSMLYSFICSAEDDEPSENNVNDETDETDEQKDESNDREMGKTIDVQDSNITKAAERNEDGESVKHNETEDQEVAEMEKTKEILAQKDIDNCETALVVHDDKAIMEKTDTAVMENEEGAVVENHDRDWEIQAIQAEIDNQQKDWEPVYSDDEGAGAEDAAVYKIAKKRAAIIKDLEKEIVRPMNRPAAKIVPENHVAGEGWKRLQLRAETRVKNFPELYQTYPVHKFPLRD